MKKLVKIFTVLFVVSLLMLTFAACKPDCKGEHTWDEAGAVITRAATCTVEGEKQLTCSVCGETTTESIPKLAHSWDSGIVTTAATCEKAGEKTFECTVCHTKKTENIDVAGHVFGQLIAAVPATCETEGVAAHYECSVCNKFFDESKSEVAQADLVLAKGSHTLGNLIAKKDATCLAEGTAAHYECSVCHKLFDEQKKEVEASALVIAKADHSYGTAIAEVPSSCTEAGTGEYYKCSVCNKLFDADKKEIDSVPQLPLAEHTYSKLNVEVDASCEEEGKAAYYSCTVCNKVFDIDKKETTLDALVIPALGHKYGTLMEGRAASCDREGVVEHYECSACHKYFDADKKPIEKISIDKIAHTYGAWIEGEASCTQPGTVGHYHCSTCNKDYDDKGVLLDKLVADSALGHRWTTEEIIPAVEPDCENAGNVAYWYCDRCNKNFSADKETEISNIVVPALGHTYGDLIAAVAPTCEDTGVAAHYECSVCNKLFDSSKKETTAEALVVAATGHTYGTLVEAAAATCEAAGTAAHFECSVCHKLFDADKSETTLEALQASLPALGHDIVENACSRCDFEYTEDEVLEMLWALQKGKEMEGTYKLTGLVTEMVSSGTKDGEAYISLNMVVCDKVVLVYTLKDGDANIADVTRGKTIVAVGTLKNYNNTREFGTATLKSVAVVGEGTITSSADHATVTLADGSALPATLANASTLNIKVEAEIGYKVTAVKINGVAVESSTNVYSHVVAGDVAISVTTVDERTPDDQKYILFYSGGGASTNMDGTNQADVLGLSKDLFSVVATKNSPSNNIGLNKDGSIRLYVKDGDGNDLVVTLLNTDTYIISKITITVTQGKDGMVVYSGENNQTVLTEEDGDYIISGNSFKIKNTNEGTTQVHITSIAIYLTSTCQHVWDEGVQSKAPSCTEAGAKTFTCTKCSITVDITLPKLAHTLGDKIGTPATCEVAGVVDHWDCSVCNKHFADADGTTEITDVVAPALGHNYSDWAWVENSTTHTRACTNQGCDSSETTDCTIATDWTITDQGHSHLCSVCAHAYDVGTHTGLHCDTCNWTSASAVATVEVDGTTTYVSSLPAAFTAIPENATATVTLLKDVNINGTSIGADITSTVVIDLNGKTLSNANTSGYKLTFKNGTVSGVTLRVTSNCVYTLENVTVENTTGVAVDILGGEVVAKGNVTLTGVTALQIKLYYFGGLRDSIFRIVNNANLTVNGAVNYGYDNSAKNDLNSGWEKHCEVVDNGTRYALNAENLANITSTQEVVTFETWDDFVAALEGEVHNHTAIADQWFDGGDGKHYQKCSECENLFGDGVDHTETSALTTAATCTTDGLRTHTCSVCGAIRPEVIPAAHSLTDVEATAATCTTAGNIAYKHCSVCNKNFNAEGEELETVATEALGHSTVVKFDATQHWDECTRCNLVIGEKVDHSFTDGKCTCGKLSTGFPVKSATQLAALAPASGDSAEKYFAIGTVKSVESDNSNFTIVDEDGNDIPGYRVYDISGSQITLSSSEDFAVGKVVVLYSVINIRNSNWQLKNAILVQAGGTAATTMEDLALETLSVAGNADADFTLPTSVNIGGGSVAISWSSNNAAIAISGGNATVTATSTETTVTLTASAVYNGGTAKTRTFDVTIPAEGVVNLTLVATGFGTTKTSSFYVNSGTATISDIAFSFATLGLAQNNNGTSNWLQMKKGSEFWNTSAIPGNITKITINWNTSQSTNIKTGAVLYYSLGTSAITTAANSGDHGIDNATGTTEIDVTGAYNYIRFTHADNGAVYIDSIVISYMVCNHAESKLSHFDAEHSNEGCSVECWACECGVWLIADGAYKVVATEEQIFTEHNATTIVSNHCAKCGYDYYSVSLLFQVNGAADTVASYSGVTVAWFDENYDELTELPYMLTGTIISVEVNAGTGITIGTATGIEDFDPAGTEISVGTADIVIVVALTVDTSTPVPDKTYAFQKVTSTADIEDGVYLIVYEKGSLALNGGLETIGAVSNNIATGTISGNQIATTSALEGATFTLTSTGNTNEFTMKSVSGYYLGNKSNSNSWQTSKTEAYTNTITINADGSAQIVGSGGSILRYNKSSGQETFKYFKSGTYTSQEAICLYKLVEVTE